MRAVKGSLGHSFREGYRESDDPSWATGTSRRASGWGVKKSCAVEDQSAAIPWEGTSELGGSIVETCSQGSRERLGATKGGWVRICAVKDRLAHGPVEKQKSAVQRDAYGLRTTPY